MTDLPRLGTPEDKIEDRDFGDLILTGVDDDRPEATSWRVRVDYTCFGIPKAPGLEPPQIGDRVRMWPSPQFGNQIRGVALRGTVVHHRTEAEHKQKLADEAAERDRKKKAEWVFCCEQAVVFGRRAAEAANAEEDRTEVNAYFAEIGVAEVPPTPALRWLYWWANERDGQADRMPGMDAGHSGNTFGTAFELAVFWLTGNSEGILKRYGAMAPVVGSEAYGDVPVGDKS